MEQQPMNTAGEPPQPPGGPQPPEPPQSPTQPPQDAPAKKKMSRKKKVVLGMVIALVALLIIAGTIGGLYAWRFLEVSGELTVGEIDVSDLPDGTYEGSYGVFHVKAAVEVSVEDGRITAIAFTDNGKMAEETQQEIRDIFEEVVQEQSLNVDITSGASVSKKVSLKAVEEALGGGE
ncbi:MAG: FMN-binding protein [Actinobacteria bacterium]|nr:FMN-binding protein [Actinomycetota bacterium]